MKLAIHAMLACALAAFAARADAAQARFEAGVLEFGRILKIQPAERPLKLSNMGDTPLRIRNVALTPPLQAVRMPREVAPGATAEITVRLDPKDIRGRYEGTVTVLLDATEQPEVVIPVHAEIVQPVELLPRPMFFVAAMRGKESSATLEIVNNEAEPLVLNKPQHSGERFTTELTTVEPGKRYALTLRMKPTAAAGRSTEIISIETSSALSPRIAIAANTLMRERVHTFPDVIDLGTIPLREATTSPELLRRIAQTLMVYQLEGSDFQIEASTDVPGVFVDSKRGPNKDRYQLTLWLDHTKVKAGTIRGTLAIRTNDREWPRIEVPISGAILGE
jgi:hypothetical protein